MSGRVLGRGLLLAGVLLVAVNLRPVITAVGPVLPQIGADVGLGSAALGAIGAVPVLAFAVVSPVVHPLVRRFGVERTVLGALVLLGVGTLLRSWPGPAANLWAGTALVGATVAVGNVALPVVVKKDFPYLVPRVTGTYVATQSVFAALAAGLAVPLAGAGTWRLSLGVWAVAAAVAVAVWLPRLVPPAPAGPPAARPPGRPAAAAHGHGVPGSAPGDPAPAAEPADVVEHRSVWRAPLAWQVAAYMGLQATPFYVLITWLPTLEQDLGVAPAVAGWHLFVYQGVAIVANLVAPSLMRVGRDQRFAAVGVPAVMVVATLGLTLAPGLLLAWVVLMGLSSGAAFVVTLSLMGMRARDAHTASQLSAMSQSLGYALTGTALVLAGVLRAATGPGPLLLVCLAGVAALQLLVGLAVGRSRVLRIGVR